MIRAGDNGSTEIETFGCLEPHADDRYLFIFKETVEVFYLGNCRIQRKGLIGAFVIPCFETAVFQDYGWIDTDNVGLETGDFMGG